MSDEVDEYDKLHQAGEAIWDESTEICARWGWQHYPDPRPAVWTTREMEAARRACDLAREVGSITWRHILEEEFWEALAAKTPQERYHELKQVAAVAQHWMADLDLTYGITNVELEDEVEYSA